MGEKAFATSKGPREEMKLRISAEAYQLLRIEGERRGMSAAEHAVDVLERRVESFLESLRESVVVERRRQSRGGATAR